MGSRRTVSGPDIFFVMCGMIFFRRIFVWTCTLMNAGRGRMGSSGRVYCNVQFLLCTYPVSVGRARERHRIFGEAFVAWVDRFDSMASTPSSELLL